MKCYFPEKDTRPESVEGGKAVRRIKGHEGTLMTVEVAFGDHCVSTPHTHPHEQMTYCLEGEFQFHIGEETHHVAQGDVVYIPPDVMHNCQLLTESGRLLDIFTPIREDFL